MDIKSNESSYDFFLNEDNIYLNTELINRKQDADVIKQQYGIAMVLFGLAMLHDGANRDSKEVDYDEIKRVADKYAMVALATVNIGNVDK